MFFEENKTRMVGAKPIRAFILPCPVFLPTRRFRNLPGLYLIGRTTRIAPIEATACSHCSYRSA
jgi:hypothetical protein